MKKQNGYTIAEMIMTLWVLVVLCLMGGVIYAAVHFIAKFW